MRIIFDIVHPAHVHFFKNMISVLEARGHVTTILARDKDVTCRLLDDLGYSYRKTGHPSRLGRFGQFLELAHRDLRLLTLIRRFRADVVLTRNPAGVQAARLAGAVGVFDTDDGSAAGVHFHAARPFATFLTSPDCLPESWGRRHWRYPGYKQTAYLHPDHFAPDPLVRDQLGVKPEERFSIVRFVAMAATHDAGETGMSLDFKEAVVERLQQHGRVFLSTETPPAPRWKHLRFDLPPSRLHHAVAFADIVVGDSQTMAAEAAVLGTPSLRASTFVGRISYLEELEHRYGLTWGFHPHQAHEFLAKLDELLALGDALAPTFKTRQKRLMRDKVNVADWFVAFLEHQCCP